MLMKQQYINMVNNLFIISYNMHGFFQGLEVVNDLIDDFGPDIILLQEHWLTPANMYLLHDNFTAYFDFGQSAMFDRVSDGPLVGRPYGGATILIKNELRAVTECIFCTDRFVVVRVGKVLVINVYLPCTGTADRMFIVEDLLQSMWSWRLKYPDCIVIIGGDFNTDLDKRTDVSNYINSFLSDCLLVRCDSKFPSRRQETYVNESLGQSSTIDFYVCDAIDDVIDYCVIEPEVNFSDHLPVAVRCKCPLLVDLVSNSRSSSSNVQHLRWDHGDLLSYYSSTMSLLYPLYEELAELENNLVDARCAADRAAAIITVDHVYEQLTVVLRESANLFIPKKTTSFYKFWWSQELDALKQNAIASCSAWKNAGKPRNGAVQLQYKQDKLLYKKRLREEKVAETVSYSNDLHEALLRKSGREFWKTWNSKFEHKSNKVTQVDGVTDNIVIADKFANYFESVCSPLNVDRCNLIKAKYTEVRSSYTGTPINDDQWFDVELLSKLVASMAKGRAAGLDELSSEHLTYSHPVLVCILAKLFNLFVYFNFIPASFGRSYTIPVPKCDGHVKALHMGDFRGISISPVISKLFEKAILDRFSVYLSTSDHQFGFKKHLSSRHAVYCVRSVIENFVNAGSTVNVCTLDLSKAFDRMNHYALFIKLMERNLPSEILIILENWFKVSVSCVKWNNAISRFFSMTAGVRQGGVLSPYLFAVFIDDLVDKIKKLNIGCYISLVCAAIFLYADDIVLLAPTVSGLQQLLQTCECELEQLDMKLNVNKSVCIRFGPSFNADCAELRSLHGGTLKWTSHCRYLGVYFVCGRTLKCSFSNAKSKFFRAFNAVFGKVSRAASEETILELIRAKCIPILLYATEACQLLSRDNQSLEFTLTRVFMKIFRTGSPSVVRSCQRIFGFLPIESQILIRTAKFLQAFTATENALCTLFERRAAGQLSDIFSKFDGVHSASQLANRVRTSFVMSEK